MTYVCWNIHHGAGPQSQCKEVNVTTVCNNQGYWEPSTDDICAEPTGTSIIINTIITSKQHYLIALIVRS